ncbi:hypothetical protein M426DRAFT_85775 [Hypoxylon sp. CI-4A]|nr:hypothetical protein M426DRAFT_85775 [Hypoxylon sp. CI-4A]
MEKGRQVAFDIIGSHFADNIQVRPRGPQSRSDVRDSFLSENTEEQLGAYTASQIEVILAQRQNVHDKATSASSATEPPPGFEGIKATKPWVPSAGEECQFRCCQRCRPSAEPRSYMSMDGIANGDIPPNAAVAFDFHRVGRRMIHPKRLENIGWRAVPWPRAFAPTPASTISSLTWTSGSTLFGEQYYDARHTQLPESSQASSSKDRAIDDIDEHEQSELDDALPSLESLHIRLAKVKISHILLSAQLTPLPPCTPEEEAALREHPTKMMEEEMEEGRFHREPLEVDHGVAILEESVSFGVPDVITHTYIGTTSD